MTSTSSSSRSSAAQRTFRSENLDLAFIYFSKPNDPSPSRITELQATVLNLEGLDPTFITNLLTSRDASFAAPANRFLPGPEKGRYEACMSIAQRCQFALNKQNFEAVEGKWMNLNETVLQILLEDEAFQYS